MEYFTTDGVFWLPDRGGRRVPGRVTFDADGVSLQLFDSLHEFVVSDDEVGRFSLDQVNVPRVYGRLHDGRDATLLAVSGLSMAGPFDNIHESWDAEFVVTGGHVADDTFDRALFEFDALMAWAQPASISVDRNSPSALVVDADTHYIATADFAGGELKLLSGVNGKWSDTEVHLEQWCQFEATGGPRTLRQTLNELVRPLQDLLIVCLGRSVRLTSISVRPPGADVRHPLLAVSFPAVQPPNTAVPTVSEVLGYNAPTLLTLPTLGIDFTDFVGAWEAFRDANRDVVTLLCGPYYAPFIYSEHRYASTFQSAEALARRRFAGQEKSADEHAKRVEDVTAVLAGAQLPPDVVAWATAVVQARNDKPLTRLITELCVASGDVGSRALAASETFARDVARARAAVSHGGAQGVDAIRRYWLGTALLWILRVLMLAETGVPVEVLAARVVKKPRFDRLLLEIATTTSPADLRSSP